MKMDKARFTQMIQIIERAEGMGLAHPKDDRIDRILDLENADKQFNLRMDDFLNADEENFIHDYCGIWRHMNRATGRCENFFVPRFACKSEREIIKEG